MPLSSIRSSSGVYTISLCIIVLHLVVHSAESQRVPTKNFLRKKKNVSQSTCLENTKIDLYIIVTKTNIYYQISINIVKADNQNLSL